VVPGTWQAAASCRVEDLCDPAPAPEAITRDRGHLGACVEKLYAW